MTIVYLVDSFAVKLLPLAINNIYLLYIAVILALLSLITAISVVNKKPSKAPSTINYLRDSGKELKEVADKSEQIINAIGDGVVLIDHENIIRILNPAAAQILGWDQKDTIGLNYKSVLKLVDSASGSPTATSDIIQHAIASNTEARSPDLTMKTNSDNRILVSLVASPIGEVNAGMIVVFRDVTKEKQEEKEQAEFISTASHEMRTPVASIEGYLGLALNPTTATIDARAAEYINKAQDSARHLGRLFQDLLDVSKADDNRLTSNPKVVDVVKFTEDIVDSLQIQASKKNLYLEFKPTAKSTSGNTRLQPIYFANVDNDHLRELITNLTENAIKYTLKGGVTLDITGNEERITISIADTGIGIPGENLPHLFQKFYRVDNKETNDIGGTGLGLYLARKLAESMNGRVWAESKYGSGSTFFIEIQRLTNQSAEQLKATQALQPEIEPSQPAQQPATPPVEIDTSPMSNYTVPRGDVLTEEQKADYVAKLRQQIEAND